VSNFARNKPKMSINFTVKFLSGGQASLSVNPTDTVRSARPTQSRPASGRFPRRCQQIGGAIGLRVPAYPPSGA